jgi:hypothetical protein
MNDDVNYMYGNTRTKSFINIYRRPLEIAHDNLVKEEDVVELPNANNYDN